MARISPQTIGMTTAKVVAHNSLLRGLTGMKSLNFEFLQRRWQDLAALGAFAEQYANPDPESAAVKLRSFAEQIVDFIWHESRLTKLFRPSLNDKLNDDSFKEAVPRSVISKLHALRIHGNKAAHGDSVAQKTVLWLLKEAHSLGCWMTIVYDRRPKADCPAFCEPEAPVDKTAQAELKREKRAVLAKLAAQEAEMQKLLTELEEQRKRAEIAQATATELQEALQTGQTAADELAFDEETTRRRLIDTALVSAGWDVGPNGIDTPTVVQEIEVPDQPTDSGVGYADYVLMDAEGTKPLAVIEAKKTSLDAQNGQTQARLYADGLANEFGCHPIIFYTNGYDIWIWNDAENEPPRRVHGFYSKDSLEYLHFQRNNRKPASNIEVDSDVVDRMYQIEAVKQVVERFDIKRRRGLIVQATGTGKTRVAIALCKALMQAGWARRILFLCDRRELRKQAHNVFKQYLPGEPRTYVTSRTSQDRDKRIYLATYPAMMKCYETFDVGFFDLVIADESHRSIYNRYGDLLKYFDGMLLGLTATPRRDLITHNTYELFGCEDNDPTAFFSYEDAINNNPPYLTPFKVETFTTPFLRKGIKYWELSEDQKQQLEEDGVEPETVVHEQHEVDKHIFNKDTNRRILRNLMENGVRDAEGTQVGKTIIFARNHNHAVLLHNLFNEIYPQYGGTFCRVIDNYDPRAEELISDFKGEGKNPELTIAISVDMLDTGIDVPEIVNLVFAKPVYSLIKFWQMIGRGTRLCKDLFGRGSDKTHFQIFDHWGNFERFDEHGYDVDGAAPSKSLLQRLFEARITLAETAINKPDTAAFEMAIKLLGADIADLPERTISVREKWKQVKLAQREENLRQFDAATKGVLTQDIAPLMQWRTVDGNEESYKFDMLICRLQRELLTGSSRFEDLKDLLLNEISTLQMNLNPVRAKAAVIAEVRGTDFWANITLDALERMRLELRGIMHYRQAGGATTFSPRVIDVTEDDALIERKAYSVRLEGLDLAAYRNRVEKVLQDLFDTNPTLQKIRSGERVTEEDLQTLNSLVHTQDADLDLNDLLEYYPETAGQLDQAIRHIIGLDAEQVHARFSDFVQRHASMNSQQVRFLDMLQNHIARYGSIEIDRLYEDPFTTLHSEGLDGVFSDEAQIQELIGIIDNFRNPSTEGTEAE